MKAGTFIPDATLNAPRFPQHAVQSGVAVYHAVMAGEKRLSAVAVAGGAQGDPVRGRTAPCGICRQVLSEFAASDMTVLMAVSEDAYEEVSLGSLLPMSFGPQDLQDTNDM